jgi:CMP-N,N'-diacetyllegionaminic acid synthase
MPNIMAVIPARSGSKGVVDKNIRSLAGKPLISYSIACAKLSKHIKRIVVSTDSQSYADVAQYYGAEIPYLRPKAISSDTSTDYDFVRHLLEWLDSNEHVLPDFLVHLRPTTPLRDPALIDAAIEQIILNRNSTALRSVHEMSETAYKTFEIENIYLRSVFTGNSDIEAANQARQTFKKTYHANGYVDIIRVSYVLQNAKLHGDNVLAFVTPLVVEVDTADDFEFLEFQAKKIPSAVNSLFME